MPQNWPEIPTQASVKALVDRAQGTVENCKNQLTDILAQAATITAADLDRIGATAEQRTVLTDQKTAAQAVLDAILAAGY